eukprot:359754-Chlamydomonas_euryale.AAC.1
MAAFRDRFMDEDGQNQISFQEGGARGTFHRVHDWRLIPCARSIHPHPHKLGIHSRGTQTWESKLGDPNLGTLPTRGTQTVHGTAQQEGGIHRRKTHAHSVHRARMVHIDVHVLSR